ncbi:MAG: class I SAM-dependent methyltransferase [Desulfobacterales bacterium]|nr:class I SAM-dependent methyltransferase [Desulfobacterales bacterium]
MRQHESSQTAETIAMYRTGEAMKPEADRICNDPYAHFFLSPETISLYQDPVKAREMADFAAATYPGVYGSVAARVRYMDDTLQACIGDGLEQLVILGAGYDTRPYRFEALKRGVKIFEVDHPATQEVKKEKVERIFKALPDHVTYVPIDFIEEKIAEKLAENGYDSALKTLFIWEGVTQYIPEEEVDDTLAFIANHSGAGSVVVFDYFPSSVPDGTCELTEAVNLKKYVEEKGEPLQFGIPDGGAKKFLAQRGFQDVEIVTSDQYKKAYFKGVNADRPVSSIFIFARAVVKG